MKYTHMIIPGLFLLILGCESDNKIIDPFSESLPPRIVQWDSSSSLVCFGTTLTWGLSPEIGGYTASDTPTYLATDSTYPNLLAAELSIRLQIAASIAIETKTAYYAYQQYIPQLNPALVLLELGMTDFRRNVDPDTVEKYLDSLILFIQSQETEVAILGFLSSNQIDNTPESHELSSKSEVALQYSLMIEDVALRHNCIYIPNVYENVWDDSLKMLKERYDESRWVPNNLGNYQVKENLFVALYNTFSVNGMLNESN